MNVVTVTIALLFYYKFIFINQHWQHCLFVTFAIGLLPRKLLWNFVIFYLLKFVLYFKLHFASLFCCYKSNLLIFFHVFICDFYTSQKWKFTRYFLFWILYFLHQWRNNSQQIVPTKVKCIKMVAKFVKNSEIQGLQLVTMESGIWRNVKTNFQTVPKPIIIRAMQCVCMPTKLHKTLSSK